MSSLRWVLSEHMEAGAPNIVALLRRTVKGRKQHRLSATALAENCHMLLKLATLLHVMNIRQPTDNQAPGLLAGIAACWNSSGYSRD